MRVDATVFAGPWVGLLAEYWHIAAVALLLLLIGIGFVFRFVVPAWQLGGKLSAAISALRDINARRDGNVVDLEEIGAKAMSDPALSHLWREYAKTLHPQRKDGDNGLSRIVRWRATALADSFFSEQAVVDARLRTEYYKHVPGILTGIGIIGTFSGLIIGLSRFKVPKDLTLIQEQLGQLMNSVRHAFYASAAAIGLAMLFTWAEKSLVAARYRQVESLRELVDSMFEGGAGEEYLERVATAAEMSATQAAQLKDSLVGDLKEILTAQMTRQIDAQAAHSSQLAGAVGEAISKGLGPPMGELANVVRDVRGDQGEAVNKMLTDVLASFASQMREMFGGQMTGMSELMRKASESMQATAIQFGQLATNMGAAGTNTVNAMGERLGKALDAMDTRQAAMNAQMGAFVEQIRALVSESQTESSQKLKDTLAAVGDQVAGVVEQLRKQAEQAAESQGKRHDRFEEATDQAIGSLSGQVEQLLRQSMATNESLQGAVASLAQATDQAIKGMNSGAETLYLAATDFAKAGQGVSETMHASTTATEAIKAASIQLTMSTDGARAIFADYAKTRDTFANMVTDLKQTVENAKRDASMTSGIIEQIQAAATQLGVASRQSEEYLRDLSAVLGEAHGKFTGSVEQTLHDSNRAFHGHLASAVGLLSGAITDLSDAIEDLGDALDELPPRR
ncbi:hypothetical protein D5041_10295 [Verminephrobacter aporrectodeae subsp. tuberculatae]|uniref:Uncharacterized protein n=1 Tax=Verminephrobacter aporrectodeae subsp. tuberculatae TaxID=1110392 RepID=A0ABT3KRE6_9BURK|nr:anti-phage ZorAB system protein ZorA [Verminephrobacter aporrectodeae]MCW5220147.1 hypothetical protein [Verminephrobacter aporrectodeae subsp. tuberculatae]MCW5289435.1 hypothetical protein [Verminephrobacter aporrectodeae subsp. tuberculatae]MCW5320904.1 hypothetical protein [Verminephrobacter aporrectodeae subsp. tuberculatae]